MQARSVNAAALLSGQGASRYAWRVASASCSWQRSSGLSTSSSNTCSAERGQAVRADMVPLSQHLMDLSIEGGSKSRAKHVGMKDRGGCYPLLLAKVKSQTAGGDLR